MDFVFPVSGVETPLWLPPLVAFVVSTCTSMAGVSGAFLLLPFQMSVLGFVSPAVSPTNLVYNVVAIPSGVWRYLREGRMVWPLTWTVVVGTLPGVILGGFIRLQWLPDPKPFKAFAGCVLLYIGLRLVVDLARTLRRPQQGDDAAGGEHRAAEGHDRNKATPPARTAETWDVKVLEFSWRTIRYQFQGECYQCSGPAIFALSLAVGVVGGVYGIGGGAIIAPFFVAIFRLPVHTVAGATLMGTFVTSIVGVAFYQLVAPSYAATGLTVAPDWLLGGLFGIGGLCGMYLGARLQRFVPAGWLKVLLGLVLLSVAVRYIIGFLWS